MTESGRSRGVDRLINFSDAVVAVAVTVLALPLIDFRPEQGQTVYDMLLDNAGRLLAFLFTFAVVAIMWAVHNRVLNGIRSYDGFIFWLNTAWLALIALLPWFSSLYGEGSDLSADRSNRPDAAIVYWLALALLSVIGSLMDWHLRRNPQLMLEREQDNPHRSVSRGMIFAGYFVLIGVTEFFAPNVADWLPLGIIALSFWLRPIRSTDGRRVHD